MGFNIGAFAGGAAEGYRKQSEDMRRQSEEKRKQDEADRMEADRKKYEEIVQSVSEKYKDMLKQSTPDRNMPKINQLDMDSGGMTGEIIRNTVAGAPQKVPTVNAAAADGLGVAETQERKTGAPYALNGIRLPEGKAEPQYREATPDDRFKMTDDMYGQLLQAGMFDKAVQVGQARSAMLAEKLQSETRQRADAARGMQAAMGSKDDAALLSAMKVMSDLYPDGNEVNAAKFLPDGKIEVAYGDSAPVAITPADMMQRAAALVSPETAFNLWTQNETRKQQAAENERQAKKDDRSAKHQDDALAETKRSNIANEGINTQKVINAAAKDKNDGYKVEGSEVATVLGDPAVDAKGRPVLDPLSGRQVVNRNQEKESAFYKWMSANDIKDTNEGLAKYMALAEENPTPKKSKKEIDWSKY